MTNFRHLSGLPDNTPIIPTAPLQALQLFLPDVADNRLIMQVSGPNGAGKTSGVHFALENAAANNNIDWFEVRVTNNPSSKALLSQMCAGVGITPNGKATEQEMIDLVVEELSKNSWVVWLDEVENATASTLRAIRHVFDHPDIASCLILSGDHRLPVHLHNRESALESRVGRRITFQRIHDDDAYKMLKDYHPLWDQTHPDKIVEINRRVRGEFRQWARITEILQTYGPQLPKPPKHFDQAAENLVATSLGWR